MPRPHFGFVLRDASWLDGVSGGLKYMKPNGRSRGIHFPDSSGGNMTRETYNYTCGQCSRPLFDPYQTSCGHRICHNCLEDVFRTKGDPAPCPYNEDDCVNISLKSNDGTVSNPYIIFDVEKLSLLNNRSQSDTNIDIWCIIQILLSPVRRHSNL